MNRLLLLLVLATPALAQPDWEPVDLGTTEDLHVLSQGSARVYVAGASGFLSKADPGDYTSWAPSDMGTTEDLISAIHVGSISSLYVSGGGGAVRYRRSEAAPWISADIPDATQAYVIRRIGTFALAAFGNAGGIFTTRITSTSSPNWVQKVSGTTDALHDAETTTFTLAVGANGTILRTDDEGETWSTVASGTTADLHAIRRRTGTDWLIVGEGGLVLKSTDDGVTWTPRASGTTSTLYAVDDRSALLAVGEDGVVLESEDNGETWCHHDSGTTATLRAVANYHPEGWLVAGDGGVLLLSQTRGGGNCTPVSAESGPDAGYTLSATWPNPTARRATLSLTVDRPQHVTAVIYDRLGRRVGVVHDGIVGRAQTLRVNRRGLAPGTYVVRVVGETFAASRLLSVLR